MNAALLFGSSSTPSSVSSVSEKAPQDASREDVFRQAFHTALHDKTAADASSASPSDVTTLQGTDTIDNSAVKPTPTESPVESLSSVEVSAEAISVEDVSTEHLSTGESTGESTSESLTEVDPLAENTLPDSPLPVSFSMAELTAEIFRATLQPAAETVEQPVQEATASVSATVAIKEAASSMDIEDAMAKTQAAATTAAEIASEISVTEAPETNPVALSFSAAGLVLTSTQEQKTTPHQSQRFFSLQGFSALPQPVATEALNALGLAPSNVADSSVLDAAAPPMAGLSLSPAEGTLSAIKESSPLFTSAIPEQVMSPLPTPSTETVSATRAAQLPGSAAALLSEAATQLEARFEVFKQVEQHLYLLRQHQQREIQIQLEPAQLGKLNLRLQQEGHLFQLHITAENAVAKEILEAHIQQLKAQFAQQGFELSRVDVNVHSDTSDGFNSETSQSQDMAAFMPHTVAMPFSLLSGETDGDAPFLNYGSAASAYYYHQVNYFA